MFMDHLWATIFPSARWLNMVGRLAFPIFAYMIVEGFHKTHDRKKYMLRLLISAIISEIPFNLIYEGSWFYPFHQNVLWTFLIAMVAMLVIEKIKEKKKLYLTILVSVLASVVAFLLGFAVMSDYYGFGVMTVLLFYFTYGKKWYNYVIQLLGMYYIHIEMFGGIEYLVTIGSYSFFVLNQGIAVLSLIPIWLYNGKQGLYNKHIKLIWYAFYPVHMILLYVVAFIMMKMI